MEKIPERRCDVLVIGGGIAGLWCAYHAAPKGEVVVLNKGSFEEANTFWAQGGMAAALAPSDAPEKHFADTVNCRGWFVRRRRRLGFGDRSTEASFGALANWSSSLTPTMVIWC
jgi:L-aspartate oxidase